MHVVRTSFIVVSGLVSGLLTGVITPRPAAPEAIDDRNAALDYWRAFEIAPDDFEVAVQEAYKVDAAWRPDAALEAALESNQGAIAMLMRATRIERCDFQPETEFGINALVPEAGLIRRASKILAADARRLLAGGDPAGAGERVAAMLAMGEHASHGSFLISSLVGCAITNNACAEAELLLEGDRPLTPETRRSILASLARFDAEDPFLIRASLANERDLIIAWARSFKGEGAGKDLLVQAAIPDAPSDAARAIGAMDERALAGPIDQASRCYDAMIAAWNAPEAKARLGEIAGKAAKGEHGPIAALLVPSMDNAWSRDHEGRNRMRDLGIRVSR